MTSPSSLSLLRTYLPEDLIDTLHEIAYEHQVPLRWVVRGILEAGLGHYLYVVKNVGIPCFDDELEGRGYQRGRRRDGQNGNQARDDRRHSMFDTTRGDPPYDEPSAEGERS